MTAPTPSPMPNPTRRGTPLRKAAQDFVWTLYVRCHHDFEGHNLPAIEEYMCRRWLRGFVR